MTIGELYNKIESWPEDTMNFRIIDVFSWRGIYAEAAAEISTERTLKQDNLDMLDWAIKVTHEGWKGGEFKYDFCTEIHFEYDYGDYSMGQYLKNFLLRNANEPVVQHIFGEKLSIKE